MSAPFDRFAMGFAAAQRAAVRAILAFADEVDVRKEVQKCEVRRTHQRNPSPEVRRLRQAASRIRDLAPEEVSDART